MQTPGKCVLKIGIQMRLRPDLFRSALHKPRLPAELCEASRLQTSRDANDILAINGMAHFLSQPSGKILPLVHECQIDLVDIGIKNS